jgi:hypothetical protein
LVIQLVILQLLVLLLISLVLEVLVVILEMLVMVEQVILELVEMELHHLLVVQEAIPMHHRVSHVDQTNLEKYSATPPKQPLFPVFGSIRPTINFGVKKRLKFGSNHSQTLRMLLEKHLQWNFLLPRLLVKTVTLCKLTESNCGHQ